MVGKVSSDVKQAAILVFSLLSVTQMLHLIVLLLWLPLLLNKWSQSLSRVTNPSSSTTQVVLLILLLAEQSLTMVSLSSDTPRMLGSLKTPGELHGVKRDTLESLELVIFVVSCHSLHIPLCDYDE